MAKERKNNDDDKKPNHFQLERIPFYARTLSSILELIRVCSSEVRVYPLQKSSLQPYEHMRDLLYVLEKRGIRYDLVPVLFEFQRGRDKMLRLVPAN
jgi:hypothetical protein